MPKFWLNWRLEGKRIVILMRMFVQSSEDQNRPDGCRLQNFPDDTFLLRANEKNDETHHPPVILSNDIRRLNKPYPK